MYGRSLWEFVKVRDILEEVEIEIIKNSLMKVRYGTVRYVCMFCIVCNKTYFTYGGAVGSRPRVDVQ